MKRLLWLIVCFMTMVVFTSCKGDIVSKARDYYKERITTLAEEKDVEVSFNNEKILIQKKDLVVMSFTINAHDKYGKYETLDFISVYAIDENGNVGTAIDTKYGWEKLFMFAKEIASLENKTDNDEIKELAKKLKTDEGIYRYTAFHNSDDARKINDSTNKMYYFQMMNNYHFLRLRSY